MKKKICSFLLYSGCLTGFVAGAIVSMGPWQEPSSQSRFLKSASISVTNTGFLMFLCAYTAIAILVGRRGLKQLESDSKQTKEPTSEAPQPTPVSRRG